MNAKEFIELIEYERFKSGIGIYEFAVMLNINYHTYRSFIKQKRKPYKRSIQAMLTYMRERGHVLDLLGVEL